MKFSTIIFVASMSLASTGLACAEQSPATLDGFKKCARIENNEARLACYDKAASAFDFAKAEKDLAAAKKHEEDAKRLREEKLALEAKEERRLAEIERKKVEQFGQDNPDVKTVDAIENEILKIQKSRAATYIMLTNQQVWKITEKKMMGILKPGRKVVIKKGIMGNFRMTIVENGRTVSVERIM